MGQESAPRLTNSLLLAGALGGQNEQDHLRLRRAFLRGYTPQRAAALTVRAETIMAELLAAAGANGRADYVSEVARPFSVLVLCELLGIPASDRFKIASWVDTLLADTTGDSADPSVYGDAIKELGYYVVQLVKDRRRTPGPDLVSALAHDTGELNTREIATVVFAVVMGGFETTTHMLGKMVLRLLTERRLWNSLRDNPALVPDAVEELLRMISVAGGEGIPWMAREHVTLSGVELAPGDYVVPAVGAANRDPAIFADPEETRFDRTGKPHLTLGYGAHFCLGSQIARMELATGLRALISTYPATELAVAPADVAWRTGSSVWQLEELPLRFLTH
ncbi:cytochrome P450 [Nocardia sp. CC201C]|uniref:cytochrome P450 n=1 Tax=Nocardia sp. CC201C TaxID=3044575 RepID=UPI0024A8D00C|nr:cytochrome P450 [Nocardia sp. CC201C]